MFCQLFPLTLLTALALCSGEHIEVATRPLSQKALLQEQLVVESEAKEGSAPLHRLESEELAGCSHCESSYPAYYYPPSCHWMTAISALGDSLEIEDGSVWKISSYDGYKILHWRANDPLLLTQNTDWFSSYNYRLINKNTGSSIAVNLFQGPVLGAEFNYRVFALDYESGDLILSDNSHWKISNRDLYAFCEWMIDDSVVIGFNSGWDYSCDSILINVQMNKHIRAKQY